MSDRVVFSIRRQDSAERWETRRWEDFAPEIESDSSVAAALFAIQQRPVTTSGAVVAPVAFDAACYGDACGACTLLIHGAVRSSCRTTIEKVARKGRIALEPLSRFPLLRDLSLDRSAVRSSFLQLSAGLDAAPAAELSRKATRRLTEIDRCSECGACLEACPEYDPLGFAGAAALSELALLGELPSSERSRDARREALIGRHGIAGCGKSENCVEVCPEGIPLVDSILRLERETTLDLLRRWRKR